MRKKILSVLLVAVILSTAFFTAYKVYMFDSTYSRMWRLPSETVYSITFFGWSSDSPASGALAFNVAFLQSVFYIDEEDKYNPSISFSFAYGRGNNVFDQQGSPNAPYADVFFETIIIVELKESVKLIAAEVITSLRENYYNYGFYETALYLRKKNDKFLYRTPFVYQEGFSMISDISEFSGESMIRIRAHQCLFEFKGLMEYDFYIENDKLFDSNGVIVEKDYRIISDGETGKEKVYFNNCNHKNYRENLHENYANIPGMTLEFYYAISGHYISFSAVSEKEAKKILKEYKNKEIKNTEKDDEQ